MVKKVKYKIANIELSKIVSLLSAFLRFCVAFSAFSWNIYQLFEYGESGVYVSRLHKLKYTLIVIFKKLPTLTSAWKFLSAGEAENF